MQWRSNQIGYSSMTYRPFTLEGNFLASQAVQEMLLQSWSSQPGTAHSDIIRVFPAVPGQMAICIILQPSGRRWLQGISLNEENSKTVMLQITASKTGIVRIKNNFWFQSPSMEQQKQYC
jgi:alpha-L-fucosidase 2